MLGARASALCAMHWCGCGVPCLSGVWHCFAVGRALCDVGSCRYEVHLVVVVELAGTCVVVACCLVNVDLMFVGWISGCVGDLVYIYLSLAYLSGV